MVHKDPTKTSAILISAVGSAESQLKLRGCGPLRYDVYLRDVRRTESHACQSGARERARPRCETRWISSSGSLTERTGRPGTSWPWVTGVPTTALGWREKSVGQEGYDNVRLINLQEAIDQQVPFFVRDRKLKDTKVNRKGGAILYGLPQGSQERIPREACG